jgi:hypothetical protein
MKGCIITPVCRKLRQNGFFWRSFVENSANYFVATSQHIEKVLVMSSLKEITASPTYNPNRVLDAIIEKLQLKNDAALSRALEVAPPVISKIRHNTLPIGATILIRMHEISDFSIRELRDLMAH